MELESNFDVVQFYESCFIKDESITMPVAAVLTLGEAISNSKASTMSELIVELSRAADVLKNASFNPISLSAGTALFLRYLSLSRPSVSRSFESHKRHLVSQARAFASQSKICTEKVADLAGSFIKDGMTIMTHGYSRVVCQTLIRATKDGRKRFKVFVTETRPLGLGVRTHALLTKHGIPCTIILDSAVAYSMGKTDIILVGAEAVAENGGLFNFVGGYQMGLAASAYNKPVYALAESFKFIRAFPLTQYDIPQSASSSSVLQFKEPNEQDFERLEKDKPLVSSPKSSSSPDSPVKQQQKDALLPRAPSMLMSNSPLPPSLHMTDEQVRNNPLLDFTTPDLIKVILSDMGVFTPSGVSDALLTIYGDE